MNRAQHAALSKIINNIADELDELALVVDSMSDDTRSEVMDDHYLKFADVWFWFNEWLDEQEIQNENPARLQ
jgi:hypothetical protein